MDLLENTLKNMKDLKSITNGIDCCLKQHEDAGEYLMYNSFLPARLKSLPGFFSHVVDNLDISYRLSMPKPIENLRNILVQLSINSNELFKNIRLNNNELIKEYNDILIEILNQVEL